MAVAAERSLQYPRLCMRMEHQFQVLGGIDVGGNPEFQPGPHLFPTSHLRPDEPVTSMDNLNHPVHPSFRRTKPVIPGFKPPQHLADLIDPCTSHPLDLSLRIKSDCVGPEITNTVFETSKFMDVRHPSSLSYDSTPPANTTVNYFRGIKLDARMDEFGAGEIDPGARMQSDINVSNVQEYESSLLNLSDTDSECSLPPGMEAKDLMELNKSDDFADLFCRMKDIPELLPVQRDLPPATHSLDTSLFSVRFTRKFVKVLARKMNNLPLIRQRKKRRKQSHSRISVSVPTSHMLGVSRPEVLCLPRQSPNQVPGTEAVKGEFPFWFYEDYNKPATFLSRFPASGPTHDIVSNDLNKPWPLLVPPQGTFVWQQTRSQVEGPSATMCLMKLNDSSDISNKQSTLNPLAPAFNPKPCENARFGFGRLSFRAASKPLHAPRSVHVYAFRKPPVSRSGMISNWNARNSGKDEIARLTDASVVQSARIVKWL